MSPGAETLDLTEQAHRLTIQNAGQVLSMDSLPGRRNRTIELQRMATEFCCSELKQLGASLQERDPEQPLTDSERFAEFKKLATAYIPLLTVRDAAMVALYNKCKDPEQQVAQGDLEQFNTFFAAATKGSNRAEILGTNTTLELGKVCNALTKSGVATGEVAKLVRDGAAAKDEQFERDVHRKDPITFEDKAGNSLFTLSANNTSLGRALQVSYPDGSASLVMLDEKDRARKLGLLMRDSQQPVPLLSDLASSPLLTQDQINALRDVLVNQQGMDSIAIPLCKPDIYITNHEIIGTRVRQLEDGSLRVQQTRTTPLLNVAAGQPVASQLLTWTVIIPPVVSKATDIKISVQMVPDQYLGNPFALDAQDIVARREYLERMMAESEHMDLAPAKPVKAVEPKPVLVNDDEVDMADLLRPRPVQPEPVQQETKVELPVKQFVQALKDGKPKGFMRLFGNGSKQDKAVQSFESSVNEALQDCSAGKRSQIGVEVQKVVGEVKSLVPQPLYKKLAQFADSITESVPSQVPDIAAPQKRTTPFKVRLSEFADSIRDRVFKARPAATKHGTDEIAAAQSTALAAEEKSNGKTR